MINVSNFPNAYKEVYTILKYIDKKDLALIPQEFIDMIKTKMNDNYNYQYNISSTFEEQNILRETKAIFAYIFLNYWANENQVKEIREQFKKDIEKEEAEKKKKYSQYSTLFKNRKILTKGANTELSNQITKYRESLLTKCKNWVKAFFWKQ